MRKIFLILSVLSVQLFLSQKKTDAKVENMKNTIENTNDALSLSKKEKDLYHEKFLKFIAALKTSDRAAMDALLSDKAKKMVTEAVYKKLSTDINTNKTFDIVKTGYKPLINGTTVPMIQYKYSDDKAAEPKEIITAVFETDGKILGIKPYKIKK